MTFAFSAPNQAPQRLDGLMGKTWSAWDEDQIPFFDPEYPRDHLE